MGGLWSTKVTNSCIHFISLLSPQVFPAELHLFIYNNWPKFSLRRLHKVCQRKMTPWGIFPKCLWHQLEKSWTSTVASAEHQVVLSHSGNEYLSREVSRQCLNFKIIIFWYRICFLNLYFSVCELLKKLKPRIVKFCTCVLMCNSLPESQCNGNFDLLQPFQPITRIAQRLKFQSCFVISRNCSMCSKFLNY